MNCTFGECVGGPFDGAMFDYPHWSGDIEMKHGDKRAFYRMTGRSEVRGLRTIYFYEYVAPTFASERGEE